MITVIRNHKKFMSLLNFVFKVIEINNDHPEREGILRGVSKTVKWHVNFNVIGVCAGIAVFSGRFLFFCFFEFIHKQTDCSTNSGADV